MQFNSIEFIVNVFILIIVKDSKRAHSKSRHSSSIFISLKILTKTYLNLRTQYRASQIIIYLFIDLDNSSENAQHHDTLWETV